MSDDCPVLTDKDLELLGRFRNEIAQIQGDKNTLFEQCDITEQSGGGFKEKFIDVITSVIVLSIMAASFGATSAFFQYAIPENYQIAILSLINQKVSLPMCDPASGLSTGIAEFFSNAWNSTSCDERAVLYYQGIRRISSVIGVASGVTLRNNVRNYITGLLTRQNTTRPDTTYSITPGEQTNIYKGGKKKSRNGKRKSRNGKRKSRKSRKNKRF